ncbi:T9SS type A sorting domain-containing protein [Flagellimonas onchidii]|uniref:T9SS type A sorting domain-containing protein n=1 Tax=Flagellimonas onchidii TaxID=2562684 RepID=UPI0010A68B9D|nr:T9SS type A sorting domain-containing protein [Allomuricauda onchidii]
MRKYLLVLQLFVCPILSAQLHVDTEVANHTNEVFSLLEMDRVPHQILLDYGYDFLDVPQYNGVLKSNNYLSPGIYRELYNTILSSRVSLSVPELEAPENLEATWVSKRKTETNKLGKGSPTSALVVNGLYYKYSSFRKHALQHNSIAVVDGKYDDVYINGNWQDPYLVRSTFGMTLPVQEIANSKVSFLLTEETWYTNQADFVHSFAVNFGDGSGYQDLTLGDALLHTYANDGHYIITFRLRLNSGKYLYCRNKLRVTGTARENSMTARNPLCDIDIQWVDAERAFEGTAGSATLQIAYANTCGQITKPLIVAEGLDTGLIQESGRIGDSDIGLFLSFVEDSDSDELRNLITNDDPDSFDIIYVNWDNGTDDLRRNAYVLQEVIKWVNENKIGNTPNVVLGQSMGGVIARYALRDMENRNEDHDTNLYISHDAPHQGAHIPLGYFYMARQLVNEVLATPIGNVGVAVAGGDFPVRDAIRLLDAPATKQLLINYVREDYVLDNSVHEAWQQELSNMGYPEQTRNIALSNASHCAEPHGLSPNQQLFRLHGSGNTRAFTDILLSIFPAGFLVGVAFADLETALLGFLPGKAKLMSDFRVKAYPNNGVANIYSGSITYEKTLLWLIPITRTFTNKNFNSPDGVLFQDNFPGGVGPFYGFLDSESDAEDNFFIRYNYNLDVVDNVNFISAVSALDVGGGLADLDVSDYTRSYTQNNQPEGNKAIPFDNFTTSFNNNATNEVHLSFNPRNGDWLADELNSINNTFDCDYFCNDLFMSGSTEFCSSAEMSVDAPMGTTVTWSVNPPHAFTFPPGSSTSKTFDKSQSFNGAATIRAHVSGDCGTRILSKDVNVGGLLPLDFRLREPQGSEPIYVLCRDQPTYVRASHDTNEPIIDWEWDVSEAIITYDNLYNDHSRVTLRPTSYDAVVRIRARNSCGWSEWSDVSPDIIQCMGLFTVYPNPSNGVFNITENVSQSTSSHSSPTTSNLTVSSTGQMESSRREEKYSFQIFDIYGKMIYVKRDVKWSGHIEIDIQRFNDGIYFLKIFGKESEETHRIVLDKN